MWFVGGYGDFSFIVMRRLVCVIVCFELVMVVAKGQDLKGGWFLYKWHRFAFQIL